MLSIIEAISIHRKSIDYEAIATNQEKDTELTQILDGSSNYSIQLMRVPV